MKKFFTILVGIKLCSLALIGSGVTAGFIGVPDTGIRYSAGSVLSFGVMGSSSIVEIEVEVHRTSINGDSVVNWEEVAVIEVDEPNPLFFGINYTVEGWGYDYRFRARVTDEFGRVSPWVYTDVYRVKRIPWCHLEAQIVDYGNLFEEAVITCFSNGEMTTMQELGGNVVLVNNNTGQPLGNTPLDVGVYEISAFVEESTNYRPAVFTNTWTVRRAPQDITIEFPVEIE